MRTSRSTSLLLVPGGLAAGHAFGYFVAGLGDRAPAGEAIGHGYLGVLLRVAVPLAAAALGLEVAGGARRTDRTDGTDRTAPVRALSGAAFAAQLVALYLVIEVAEHAGVGIGPADALAESSTRWGVVGQLVVALAAVLLVSGAHTAGRLVAVAATSRPPGPAPAAPRRLPRPVATIGVPRDATAGRAPQRGPPVVLPA
jgi:hypothetical protein